MESEERDLLEAVAAALKRGQGDCSEEELERAYEQVRASQIAGTMAGLVSERRVDLAFHEGTLQYVARSGASGRPLERDALRVALGPDGHDAIADEYGGVVALDVYPMELGPLGLILDKRLGDDTEGDGAEDDAIGFTLVKLDDGGTVLGFAVIFNDLSRLISEAEPAD